MKIHFQSLYMSLLGMSVGLMGVSTVGYADTASSVFNFTATFVGGSCDIQAPANIVFNGGNTFSSLEIEQNTAATLEKFDITLSNCAGWGLTPKITISGSSTSDFGKPLFRDVMGPMDANGYGILLETLGNSSFESNQNLANNGTILMTNWSTGNQLSSIDTKLPMTATLTCGDCLYSGRQGGEFKATVTFDFVYE